VQVQWTWIHQQQEHLLHLLPTQERYLVPILPCPPPFLLKLRRMLRQYCQNSLIEGVMVDTLPPMVGFATAKMPTLSKSMTIDDFPFHMVFTSLTRLSLLEQKTSYSRPTAEKLSGILGYFASRHGYNTSRRWTLYRVLDQEVRTIHCGDLAHISELQQTLIVHWFKPVFVSAARAAKQDKAAGIAGSTVDGETAIQKKRKGKGHAKPAPTGWSSRTTARPSSIHMAPVGTAPRAKLSPPSRMVWPMPGRHILSSHKGCVRI
jgi:hypothetical protein